MGGGAMKRRLMLVVTDDWYLWSHRIGLAEAARDAGYEVTVATSDSGFARITGGRFPNGRMRRLGLRSGR